MEIKTLCQQQIAEAPKFLGFSRFRNDAEGRNAEQQSVSELRRLLRSLQGFILLG
jgi:hypothetical protein